MDIIKKILNKKWLGPAIGLIFLILAFRNFRYDEFKNALLHFNFYYLPIVLIIILLSYLIRAIRWRYMLSHVKNMSLYNSFTTIIIGQMGNSLLPVRMGELMRAYLIGNREGIGKSLSFASIVLERVMDGIILILFVVTSLFILQSPSWVKITILLSILIFGIALLLLFLSAYRVSAIPAFLQKFFPGKLKERLTDIGPLFYEFTKGLQILREGKKLIIFLIISLIIWFFEATVYFTIFKAFLVPISFYTAMFVLGITNLAAAIPSLPGNFGTFHYAFTLALLVFGISQSEGLVYATTLHGIGYIFVVALGLLFMYQFSHRLAIHDFLPDVSIFKTK